METPDMKTNGEFDMHTNEIYYRMTNTDQGVSTTLSNIRSAHGIHKAEAGNLRKERKKLHACTLGSQASFQQSAEVCLDV